MKEGDDAGRAAAGLLHLQLAMMSGALTLFASGAQQLLRFGLPVSHEPAPRTAGPLPPALAIAREIAAANERQAEYARRIQADLDTILHAFAMAPAAADRLIRTATLAAGGPGRSGGEPRRVKAPAGRARLRPAGEHAR